MKETERETIDGLAEMGEFDEERYDYLPEDIHSYAIAVKIVSEFLDCDLKNPHDNQIITELSARSFEYPFDNDSKIQGLYGDLLETKDGDYPIMPILSNFSGYDRTKPTRGFSVQIWSNNSLAITSKKMEEYENFLRVVIEKYKNQVEIVGISRNWQNKHL